MFSCLLCFISFEAFYDPLWLTDMLRFMDIDVHDLFRRLAWQLCSELDRQSSFQHNTRVRAAKLDTNHLSVGLFWHLACKPDLVFRSWSWNSYLQISYAMWFGARSAQHFFLEHWKTVSWLLKSNLHESLKARFGGSTQNDQFISTVHNAFKKKLQTNLFGLQSNLRSKTLSLKKEMCWE